MSHKVRRRKGSRHDKTGCLTCRYRRKKCSENTFPVCGTCSRLNLECIRESTRNVVPIAYHGANYQQSESSALANPIPVPVVSSMSPRGIMKSSRKRQALQYYITVLTSHLTVSEEFNSFLTAFLPMAMESEALCNALVAFASGHLSLVDQSYQVLALEARSTAINHLVAAVEASSSEMTQQEATAAASLAFVISDVGVGDCQGWYTHLKGTKSIIMSSCSHSSSGEVLRGPEAFKQSSEGQWILRNFAYHDIIGSVTQRTEPLLDGSYLAGITNVVDSCLGVATELLPYVAKLSYLDKATSLSIPLPEEEMQRRRSIFHCKCKQWEQELSDWTCQNQSSRALVSLAYAYQSTVLIVLYRLIRKRCEPNRHKSQVDQNLGVDVKKAIRIKIQRLVTKILENVAEIDVGTAPESALLFPLFIAGGEIYDLRQMEVVRTRLTLILDKRRFQNVSKALEALEDLWNLRQTTNGENADWTQVLDASGVDLLLS